MLIEPPEVLASTRPPTVPIWIDPPEVWTFTSPVESASEMDPPDVLPSIEPSRSEMRSEPPEGTEVEIVAVGDLGDDLEALAIPVQQLPPTNALDQQPDTVTVLVEDDAVVLFDFCCRVVFAGDVDAHARAAGAAHLYRAALGIGRSTGHRDRRRSLW